MRSLWRGGEGNNKSEQKLIYFQWKELKGTLKSSFWGFFSAFLIQLSAGEARSRSTSQNYNRNNKLWCWEGNGCRSTAGIFESMLLPLILAVKDIQACGVCSAARDKLSVCSMYLLIIWTDKSKPESTKISCYVTSVITLPLLLCSLCSLQPQWTQFPVNSRWWLEHKSWGEAEVTGEV